MFAADAAALEQRGRLGRARAHEHVVGADEERPRSSRREAFARSTAPTMRLPWRTSRPTRQSAMIARAGFDRVGSIVRAMVCLTARPFGS